MEAVIATASFGSWLLGTLIVAGAVWILLARGHGQRQGTMDVPMGEHVGGLALPSGAKVRMRNAPGCILFKAGTSTVEIPKSSTLGAELHDESSYQSFLTSRLTVTRMATLGVFSLALPKRQVKKVNTEPRFVVTILGKDAGPFASFVFADKGSATLARGRYLAFHGTDPKPASRPVETRSEDIYVEAETQEQAVADALELGLDPLTDGELEHFVASLGAVPPGAAYWLGAPEGGDTTAPVPDGQCQFCGHPAGGHTGTCPERPA